MASERRQQISELYNAALERRPEERTPFLKEACDGDEALRREVESLLGYECASAGLLETPAVRIALARSCMVQADGHHRRGEITILDRPGLTRAACECDITVRAYFDHLGKFQ